MATYKAEYMAHHYKGRLRPREEYSMPLIYWWARIATKLPGIVNTIAQAPGVTRLIKFAGGIAQQRQMPSFRIPFSRQFRNRSPPSQPPTATTHNGELGLAHGGSQAAEARYSTPRMQAHNRGHTLPTRVPPPRPHRQQTPGDVGPLLFSPDPSPNCLASANRPAPVPALGDAGYQVTIPPSPLCCALPLYDSGMLKLAKKLWQQVLD